MHQEHLNLMLFPGKSCVVGKPGQSAGNTGHSGVWENGQGQKYDLAAATEGIGNENDFLYSLLMFLLILRTL